MSDLHDALNLDIERPTVPHFLDTFTAVKVSLLKQTMDALFKVYLFNCNA